MLLARDARLCCGNGGRCGPRVTMGNTAAGTLAVSQQKVWLAGRSPLAISIGYSMKRPMLRGSRRA